jgi:superfamily II DNA or RNA helicase
MTLDELRSQHPDALVSLSHRDGEYTLKFEAPVREVVSGNGKYTFPADEILGRNPTLKCRIVRKAYGYRDTGPKSVTVSASQVLSSSGFLLPLQQVFEDATKIKPGSTARLAPTRASWRVAFQLDEPSDASGPWNLRFLLEKGDDASLIFTVSDSIRWPFKGPKPAGLHFHEVREHVETALRRLSDIWMPRNLVHQNGLPIGAQLTIGQASEFLQTTADLLKRADVTVLLPAWWTGDDPNRRLVRRIRVKDSGIPGPVSLSIEATKKLDWELLLGEQVVPREELEQIAALKVPFVRLRGQWLRLSEKDIQTVLEFLQNKWAAEAPLSMIIRIALGFEVGQNGFPAADVVVDGVVAELVNKLKAPGKLEELPTPANFRGELRPYQCRGFSWLARLTDVGLGACLADDMGLGKTLQTLALIQRNWRPEQKRPVLLICPASVVSEWRRQKNQFTPDLPVLFHHTPDRTRSRTGFWSTARSRALVISTYGLLVRDMELFSSISWAGLILDEAQNIKNFDTAQSQAARSLAASVDYRIALTGTPVENHVGELWSIMEFLNPGLLGTRSEFNQRFLNPIQRDRSEDAKRELRELIAPFVLRREKTNKDIIADLPEKREFEVHCSLTREQATLYRALQLEAQERLATVDGIERRGVILGLLTKFKQVCNHPANYSPDDRPPGGRSGKLDRITEMLGEVLAAGERALVFTQSTTMAEILENHLSDALGVEVLYLHGSLTSSQRDRLITRFQTSLSWLPIFLLSLRAGGTGLNLTRANHVFHFDRWWNPAVENQATDRAFRIGQEKDVQVYKLVCGGTLEERIAELIARKKELAEGVIQSGESALSEMLAVRSNAEIMDFVRLDEEAVTSDQTD